MTMGRDLKHERYVDRLLEELKYEMDLKPRINQSQFHNFDFLDGYAFGLRVAMDIIIGRKSDEV